MLTSRFEETRGLFSMNFVNLNLSQMMRTTPELVLPSLIFRATPAEGRLAPKYDLACSRPNTQQTTDLRWNRVSGLVPSGSEARTLPLGRRGPYTVALDLTFLHELVH
ncbi:hypothetical protein AVEN_217063-1 [Araneus ventricosus]|uniref:Uncharacterized protein n=1 Tax=Araneus ventricosus TaxID=182803 RepID=A0A4Y2C9J7_ARAVE|nr:hypothetical protein AVEN_25202-1 [Araneus ventricosus]GBM00428.1 hypothetical protein AVEN_84722-1 [Araneus ventricosus]GBM00443.1 hypothetical protein AVEN_117897-1 [Araneus ventricosus]GBM00466.1 hypothetical protein AVEN_217063-1 [Araneus ventricosus]